MLSCLTFSNSSMCDMERREVVSYCLGNSVVYSTSRIYSYLLPTCQYKTKMFGV